MELKWWVYADGDRIGPFDDDREAGVVATDIEGDDSEVAVEVVLEPDYRLVVSGGGGR